ncbi:uncharacterized protein N7443_005122 [Penicillium atrosanguineum]|uniref:uncharacterized protein n=1 Tax=Penicillium atrosanguineum TaxID=1132637 RepID=UPI00239A09B4|nr:uncharacterized protein N7443_005122 [Penicillium atrosanguineum]KAJ5305462.1 hypothetical protein N7443_005122 [Penicillium atrosanguineum]
MALVAYSDSEGSDSEPETTPAPSTTKKPESGSGFRVDRSNPRKIQVALPEVKPEHTPVQDEDGPARKKPRVGGGGAFSGFNSFLPAPKKAEKKAPVATTRKVFSLKTGAAPGFSREADAEMRNDFAFGADAVGDDNTIPAAGSLGSQPTTNDAATNTEVGEVKMQGNPMMFRPLSVARNQKKKKTTTKLTSQPTPSAPAPSAKPAETVAPQPTTTALAAPAPPKPKVSLFSLSSEDTSRADEVPTSSGTYEPLVYSNETESASAAPAPAAEFDSAIPTYSAPATVSSQPSTLDNIANDLNLSKAERRQLFGRNAPPAESRILEFNTDKEYATNQVLAKTELAATQHNPVRAIAPGKHSLQQLVNAASAQKEALEESFATGRRNKKEAGSKYGW